MLLSFFSSIIRLLIISYVIIIIGVTFINWHKHCRAINFHSGSEPLFSLQISSTTYSTSCCWEQVPPLPLGCYTNVKTTGLFLWWELILNQNVKVLNIFSIFSLFSLINTIKNDKNNIFGTIFTWNSQSNSKKNFDIAYKIQAI